MARRNKNKIKIFGNTYRERCNYQLNLWVAGTPAHNSVDGECCPDFSCCKPELLADKEIRLAYKNASEAQRESFCFSFLCAGLEKMNVHVVNGRDEINSQIN